ncbi:hypothetical protein GCM10010211_36220 [Streptomyces albospinus]|uniref:Uncharacterized protein n=1 Tax=Streptomyces albospinus TaxID=285515 RepID=A0ABQ2V3P9_9ACTN|nr:hypothetical protein GCM10010211_36220 [Streptomyces albospinus]
MAETEGSEATEAEEIVALLMPPSSNSRDCSTSARGSISARPRLSLWVHTAPYGRPTGPGGIPPGYGKPPPAPRARKIRWHP